MTDIEAARALAASLGTIIAGFVGTIALVWTIKGAKDGHPGAQTIIAGLVATVGIFVAVGLVQVTYWGYTGEWLK